MSKETSVFLPIAMAAYDLTIGGEGIRPALRWVKRYAPFVAAGIFYLAARSYSLGGIAPMRNTPDMEQGDILINFFPLVWAYIHKLVLPVKLVFYEYLTPAHSIADGMVIFSILVIIAIIIPRRMAPAEKQARPLRALMDIYPHASGISNIIF